MWKNHADRCLCSSLLIILCSPCAHHCWWQSLITSACLRVSSRSSSRRRARRRTSARGSGRTWARLAASWQTVGALSGCVALSLPDVLLAHNRLPVHWANASSTVAFHVGLLSQPAAVAHQHLCCAFVGAGSSGDSAPEPVNDLGWELGEPETGLKSIIFRKPDDTEGASGTRPHNAGVLLPWDMD